MVSRERWLGDIERSLGAVCSSGSKSIEDRETKVDQCTGRAWPRMLKAARTISMAAGRDSAPTLTLARQWQPAQGELDDAETRLDIPSNYFAGL